MKVNWTFRIWEDFLQNVIPRSGYAVTKESPGTVYVPAEQYGEWHREIATALAASQ